MNVRKLTAGGCFIIVAIILLAAVGLLLLWAWALMWSYNASLPPWLGWPPLTYREAFGLSVLIGMVAGLFTVPATFHRTKD